MFHLHPAGADLFAHAREGMGGERHGVSAGAGTSRVLLVGFGGTPQTSSWNFR